MSAVCHLQRGNSTIILLILLIVVTMEFAYANPQARLDDMFQKNRINVGIGGNQQFPGFSSNWNEDWNKQKEKNDAEFKEFNEKSETIFWILTGVSLFIFLSCIVTGCCCLFVPACWFAKSMSNRRARRNAGQIPGPTVYSTNVNGQAHYPAQIQIPGTSGNYPLQTTTINASNYPQQYHSRAQLQTAGNDAQNSPYHQPLQPIGNANADKTGQLPYNPYHGIGAGGNTISHSNAGYPNNPPPYPAL